MRNCFAFFILEFIEFKKGGSLNLVLLAKRLAIHFSEWPNDVRVCSKFAFHRL